MQALHPEFYCKKCGKTVWAKTRDALPEQPCPTPDCGGTATLVSPQPV